ncbi:hypothetical protein Q1695_013944 [Nippostrongylus brasiliensis]|nr:hypothetical protein Q1695_013944 [Nippostrongylus brasiliensis]
MKAVLILSLSLLQLQEANHTDDYFILKAPIHELLMPDGTTTENNIHEDLLFISTVGKISANPPVFICVDYERANINIDDEKYTPCITAEATNPNCEDWDVHTGVANKKAAGLCWRGNWKIVCALKNTSNLMTDVKLHEMNDKMPSNPDSIVEKCLKQDFVQFGERVLRKQRRGIATAPEPLDELPRTTAQQESTTTTKPPTTTRATKPPEEAGASTTTTEEPGTVTVAGKLKRIKVKQNETARVLAGIGAFTCILLFIQIVVLAMSIKLIKRQVIRDL